MARCWFANILLTNQTLLNITSFGDEPSPLHFGFQAAFEIGQTFPTACAAKLHTLHALFNLHTFFRLPLFIPQRQPENHYPCINLSVLNSKCRPAAAG